jgi:hypothetical protein
VQQDGTAAADQIGERPDAQRPTGERHQRQRHGAPRRRVRPRVLAVCRRARDRVGVLHRIAERGVCVLARLQDVAVDLGDHLADALRAHSLVAQRHQELPPVGLVVVHGRAFRWVRTASTRSAKVCQSSAR